MKKKLLIPILLTTTTPLISLASCNNSNDPFQPQSFEFSFPYSDWQIEKRTGEGWVPYAATTIYLSEIRQNPRIWAEDCARHYSNIVSAGSLQLTLSKVDTPNLTMDCEILFDAGLAEQNIKTHYIFKNIEFAMTYRSDGKWILFPMPYFLYLIGSEDDTALANAVANLKSHQDWSIKTFCMNLGQVLYDETWNSDNIDSDALNCIESISNSLITSYYLSSL